MKSFLSTMGQKVFQFIDALKGAPIHKFDDYESYLRAASNKLWIAYRCAKLTAHVVSSTEYTLVDTSGKEINPTAAPKIANADAGRAGLLAKLLVRPNPFDTFEEFLIRLTYHLKFCGKAYIHLDELTVGQYPSAMYLLQPARVKIHPDPLKRVLKYEYQINGKSIYYEPNEIVEITDPHPNSEYFGWGDFEGGESLLSEFIGRASLNASLVDNGGVPSGILTAKDPGLADDEKEWKKKKAAWMAENMGKSKNGKIAWLAGEWEFIRLGLTMAEVQDVERSKLTVEQIMMLMGVPKSLVAADAANYATARQDEMNFRKYTCRPIIDLIVGRLNEFVCTLFGPARIDYSLSGLIDVEQIGKDYGWLFDRGGCTRNDLRKFSGMKTVKDDPDFDKFYFKQGSTYEPAEMAGLTLPNPNDIASANGDLRTPNVPARSQRN